MRFRPLTVADLPLLHGWLNDPAVVRWWEGEDVSWGAVQADYGPDRDDRVEHWIAVGDTGTDVGWIQCYTIAPFLDDPDGDEARAWVRLGIPPTAAGIDYLLGQAAARGHGLGTRMIDEFVDQVVFGRHAEWDVVCASPYAANTASWRALASAGFDHVATFGDEHGDCHVMRRDRDPGTTADDRAS